MGCASSQHKRNKATVDVYHPAPASFAVFDISAIEEPWLIVEHATQEHQEKEKLSHVPETILEKLHTFEKSDSPHSWEEVSKVVLEDLKRKPEPEPKPKPIPVATSAEEEPANKKTPRKSVSFHTVEELDAKAKKLSSTKSAELRKTESMRTESTRTELESFKSVKENVFLVKDRMEREREGKPASFVKRDPLSEFPEKCPRNGGADSVVLYTTSLRGIRRTYEDCNRARSVLETHRVVFDERDVSLHAEFLTELKELLLGESESKSVNVPRVFVKGRYIGGVEELVELNETGRLGKILSYARVEKGVGRQACEGCGGMRFVPCLECGGSCKVLKNGDKKERCEKCNENGLVHCPACN
ncbi:glutaredoxin domain-containing cysteine-rich protein CG31559 [Fagus crenata]